MSRLCRRLLTMHVALAPTVRLFSLLGFAISQTRCKPMLLMPSTAIISGRATPLILAPLPALPPLPELIQVCVFFTLLSLSLPLIALLPPPPHTQITFFVLLMFLHASLGTVFFHFLMVLFEGFFSITREFQGNSFIYLIFLFFEILMFLCFQAMDLVFIHHLQGIYFLPPLLFIFLKTSSCCFSQSCSNAFFIYIYIYMFYPLTGHSGGFITMRTTLIIS